MGENKHLLVSSCLDGRKQFVSFGGYESTCEKSEVGLPQGSVLGPLFFLIHVNDLQNYTSLTSSTLQTTQCYTKHSKDAYLNDSKHFKIELKKVSVWLMGNKFKLNLDKTRSMILYQSKNSFWKNKDPKVKIDKTVVSNTNSYKYLGIIIVGVWSTAGA